MVEGSRSPPALVSSADQSLSWRAGRRRSRSVSISRRSSRSVRCSSAPIGRHSPTHKFLHAMALYSLRSQRFHRLCLPCAYRRPEGSHQQGRQQDQQGCKVKAQIIRLHPV